MMNKFMALVVVSQMYNLSPNLSSLYTLKLYILNTYGFLYVNHIAKKNVFKKVFKKFSKEKTHTS